MKYLIASDIHGSLPALEQILKHYQDFHCDMLCLLGDLLNYGPRNSIPDGLNPQAVAQRLNDMSQHIVAVRGNCESEVDQMLLDFPVMADYALLVDEGCRLFLTHGHIYNEQNLPKSGFDAFFFGHTHLWKLERSAEGKMICNLGSPTFPKGGNPPTFAIYENRQTDIYLLNGICAKSLCL